LNIENLIPVLKPLRGLYFGSKISEEGSSSYRIETG
jgi:hypothetical protein